MCVSCVSHVCLMGVSCVSHLTWFWRQVRCKKRSTDLDRIHAMEEKRTSAACSQLSAPASFSTANIARSGHYIGMSPWQVRASIKKSLAIKLASFLKLGLGLSLDGNWGCRCMAAGRWMAIELVVAWQSTPALENLQVFLALLTRNAKPVSQ